MPTSPKQAFGKQTTKITNKIKVIIMPAKTTKSPDIKELLAEIKYLKAENRRLGEAFTLIQTRHSRKLLYDWLTLADAKQLGVNIEAIIGYAFGDVTKAQLAKTIKHVGGR